MPSDSSSHDLMLEQRLGEVYKSLLALMILPLSACACGMAAAQASYILFRTDPVLPTLFLAAGVLYLAIGWSLALQLWPSSAKLQSLISLVRKRMNQEVGVAAPTIILAMLAMLMAVPGVIGAVLWSAAFFCFLGYPAADRSQHMDLDDTAEADPIEEQNLFKLMLLGVLRPSRQRVSSAEFGMRLQHWLPRAQRGSGVYIIFAAIALLVEYSLSSDTRFVSATIGALILVQLLFVVLRTKHARPLDKSHPWQSSSVIFWRILHTMARLTALFPIAVGAASVGLFTPSPVPLSQLLPLLVVGFVFPVPLFLIIIYRMKRIRQHVAYLYDRHELRSIIGRDAHEYQHGIDGPAVVLGAREDEIRQGDGYATVSYPGFKHWDARFAGEGGYLAWIGGTSNPIILHGGEAAVFRCTSLRHTHLCDTVDQVGVTLGRLCLDFFPDRYLSAAPDIISAFRGSWSVRTLAADDVELLPKMPWDHPFLLAVPLDWTGVLCLPAGSGIHDRSGFPCQAQSLKIRIKLQPDVVSSIRDLHRSDEGGRPPTLESVGLCRSLVWNALRILPATYETILTCLIRLFRSEEIEAFLDADRTGSRGNEENESSASRSVAGFLKRLTMETNAALPRDISTLVTLVALDIDVDTYFMQQPRERLIHRRASKSARIIKPIVTLAIRMFGVGSIGAVTIKKAIVETSKTISA